MEAENKIKYFDYFISRLIFTQYREDSCDDMKTVVRENTSAYKLDKLRLMKLLFFASALRVNEKYLVDDIFDQFYAMPYGPVESDVFDYLRNLQNYNLSSSLSLKTSADLDYSNLCSNIKEQINQAIDSLHSKYPKLFTMSSFDLVELSHKSIAWRLPFQEAKKRGRMSGKIPCEIIKSTIVYFQ